MAEGRHLGKIEKSPYLGNDAADFYQIWHGDTLQLFEAADRRKFGILKIQHVATAILENRKTTIY